MTSCHILLLPFVRTIESSSLQLSSHFGKENTSRTLAQIWVASVQEKTRQPSEGTGGPLKIDTEVQSIRGVWFPCKWIAPVSAQEERDHEKEKRRGIDFQSRKGEAIESPIRVTMSRRKLSLKASQLLQSNSLDPV